MVKEFVLAALVTITTAQDAKAPPMDSIRNSIQLEFRFENGPKCRMTVTEGTHDLKCSDIPTTVKQQD